MSYRFGLSPSDVVTDSRGNVLNTTLTLYVLEADAVARTNALASVQVSSGDWTYTSSTYKFLWARTATSDPFFVVAEEALAASLNVDTALTVTDNGDGGFTVGGKKLGGWQWVKDTFVTIVNAVALSTTTPLVSTLAGTAGTANTAARGDHQHIAQAVRPSFIVPSGLWITDVTKSDTANANNALGALTVRPMNIVTPNHQSLSITGLGVLVGTAGSANSVVKVGIWKTNTDGTIDWTQLVAQASLATDTAGVKKATFSAITLPEGLYWIGGVPQGTTAAQLRGADPNGYGTRAPHHDPTSSQVFDQIYAWSVTGITGALPTATPAGSFQAVNNDLAMNVWMRVA